MLAAAEREIAETPGQLASRPHELSDKAFEEKILYLQGIDHGTYIVAEDEGQIVGHALLEPLKLAVTSHVVDLTIVVHSGHQGKGYGRLMMNYLIDWAREQSKVEKIELHVRSSNQRAIDLYQKLGFEEQGRKWKKIKIAPDHYLDDISMGLWVGEEN